MNAPAKSRGPVFWAVVAGVVVLGCCVFSAVGMAVASLFVASEPEVAGAPSSGRTWLPAGEVGRSEGLTAPLAGRWVYLSGGSVDSVVARTGITEWVQTNSSGTRYEFVFSDGEYEHSWGSAVTLFGGTSRSSCVEQGSWSLDGTTLRLEPSSQKCTYVATTGMSQTKEDVDLSARAYRVVDIEFETITSTGAALQRFPGIELSGPKAKWDVTSGDGLSLDLQRL